MKLVVRQLSGLGNQMFQYAAGMYYARVIGAEMEMAIEPPHRANSHGHPRPFLLSNFTLTKRVRELNRFEQVLILSAHKTLRVILEPILGGTLGLQVISEQPEAQFLFQPKLPILKKVKKAYLLGYWQVCNIPMSMEEEIRTEFKFKHGPAGRNLETFRRIKNDPNSVSLHIRRGDYTLAVEGNIALPLQYYTEAIAELTKKLRSPTFYIFSDDMEFAKNALSSGTNAVFVDHNGSLAAHEDLRLMATCQHHIIANSTFSWWGAWLNPSSNKLIYAPRNWLVGNRSSYRDLFPPNWILID